MTTGKLSRVDYTSGGAGNQWTTIDDVKYATYWDIRTIDWKRGDTVTFEVRSRPLWTGHPSIPHAENIHKAKP